MAGEGWILPALVATTIFGALLRVRLVGIGVWRDEAYTYFDVTQATLRGTFEHIVRVETNPPLFFVLERAVGSLFGFGELALKSLPLVCGIALVPAVYALGRTVMGRFGALLAAWLVAVSEPAIYYSQELRPYSLAALLIALTARSYVRWVQLRERRPWWLVPGALLAFAHYIGPIVIAGLALGTAFLQPARRPRLLALAAALSVLALIFAPWVPGMLAQLQAGTPWVSFLPYAARFNSGIAITQYTLPFFTRDPGAGFLFAYLGILILGFGALALHSRLRREGASTTSDVGTFVMLVAVLWSLCVEAMLGYRDPRYVFPLLPLATVPYVRLLSDAVERLCARLGAAPAVAPLALAYLVLVASTTNVWPTVYLSSVDHPKTGMRAAGEELSSGSYASAAVLVAPDYAAPSCAFYLPGRPVHGFPRWDDPQYFDIVADTAAWNAPFAVARTLAEVEKLAAKGSKELAVVRPTALDEGFTQAGRLPYQLSNDLLEGLRKRYPVVARFDYPANVEWASAVVFDLSHPFRTTHP